MTFMNVANAKTSAYGIMVGSTTGVINSVAPPAVAIIPTIYTSAGASANPAFTLPTGITFSVVHQVFSSSGTYTPTSGMVYCLIECIGAGGGGGGSAGSNSTSINGAASGGGGEYACGIFSSATIGASKSVTIGAAGTAGANTGTSGGTGGTTSVGSTNISAVGGGGGTGNSSANTAVAVAGGIGGTGGTGGDYRMPGTCGVPTFGIYSSVAPSLIIRSDLSGNSFYGVGGITGSGTVGAQRPAGNPGFQYGVGGSGGVCGDTTNTAAGAVGFKGVVIITEYVT